MFGKHGSSRSPCSVFFTFKGALFCFVISGSSSSNSSSSSSSKGEACFIFICGQQFFIFLPFLQMSFSSSSSSSSSSSQVLVVWPLRVGGKAENDSPTTPALGSEERGK